MDITAIDAGLLLLRLGLAFILFTHATQKLFGWFSGGGPVASAGLFEKLGQRPGKVMVYLAVTCELTAAISLLLGLLVPLGVAIGLGTMLVAGASLSFLKGTFWNSAGGGEYPFFIAFVIACVGLTGPGRVAIDATYALPLADQPLLLGSLAILLGLVAAIPPVLRTRASLAATQA